MDAYESTVRDVLEDPVKSIVRMDEGWTHIVLEVNRKWIFRFVRDPSNTQLAVEQAFLPLFKGLAPLPIPEIRYSDTNFIAYEKIEGVKFSEAIFKRLDRNERTKLAAALGDFLSCLHAVTFEHRYLKTAPFGGGDFWEELWLVAAPRLQTSARKRAKRYFQRELSRIGSAAYPNVVTHSDFGTGNVLIDPARSKLTGVIDFGDISIGDPAADFATFYRRIGKPFAEDMAKAYRLPLGEDFWTRVDCQSKRKLFFALFFALNHGFDEHVPGLVRAIESRFAEGRV